MINFKNVLPFWIVLILNICSLLILGWNFGPTTGYGLVTTWSSVWLVLDAIFMIVSFMLIVLMLILSIWGICTTENRIQVGKFNMQTIIEFFVFVFALASVCVFVFSSASVGFVSFGALLYILVIAFIIATYFVLRKKGLIEKQGLIQQFSQEIAPKKQKKIEHKKSKIEKEWFCHSFFKKIFLLN